MKLIRDLRRWIDDRAHLARHGHRPNYRRWMSLPGGKAYVFPTGEECTHCIQVAMAWLDSMRDDDNAQ